MERVFTKRSALWLTFAAALLSPVSVQAQTRLAKETDQYLMSFQSRPVVGLGKLIANLLPPHGFKDLGWGYLADSPIISWQTSGIHYGSSENWRLGFVRVEVDGKEPAILLQRWQTIPWSVTLTGGTSNNAEPDAIEISPGVMDGKHNCFGQTARGCNFSLSDVFSSPYINSGFLCLPSTLGGQTAVFVVSATGKDPSILVWQTSGGSGGVSTSLEIHPLSDAAKLCTPTEMPPLISQAGAGPEPDVFQGAIPPVK